MFYTIKSVDVMHDLLKDICRYDIALIFNHFLNIKKFFFISVNNIIRGFYYNRNEKKINRDFEYTFKNIYNEINML